MDTGSNVQKEPRGKASDGVEQARPSEKELRQIVKGRPALGEVRDYLKDIYRLARCLNYQGYEDVEESKRVTPALFWEYLGMLREDMAEDYTDDIQAAFNSLDAILSAKPK